MKIKLAPYWWINFYFLGIIILVANLFCLYVAKLGGFTREDFVMLIVALGYTSVGVFTILYPYPFLIKLLIEEDKIDAFLFGKRLSSITQNMTVYYRVFTCRESAGRRMKYIFISNEKFDYDMTKESIWRETRNFTGMI